MLLIGEYIQEHHRIYNIIFSLVLCWIKYAPGGNSKIMRFQCIHPTSQFDQYYMYYMIMNHEMEDWLCVNANVINVYASMCSYHIDNRNWLQQQFGLCTKHGFACSWKFHAENPTLSVTDWGRTNETGIGKLCIYDNVSTIP